MRSADIVVVGSYNRDQSFLVTAHPGEGETVLAHGSLRAHGGKGSNQAVQAARMGASVGLIAAVGNDDEGLAAKSFWEAEGIDIAAVQTSTDAFTGSAVIMVADNGENIILVDSGANACLDPLASGFSDRIATAKIIVGQLEVPAAVLKQAFAQARQQGSTTILNAAPIMGPVDEDLLALVDILVVNRGEAAALARVSTDLDAGALARSLLAHARFAVVVTLGGEGAVVAQADRPVAYIPSLPTDVVDTTGAGDAFIGAMAAMLAENGDLADAASWAVAAGSCACSKRGATPSFCTLEEISRKRAVGSLQEMHP